MATITRDDLVAALAADPRFQDEQDGVDYLAPYMELLPAAATGRLDEPITLAGFCQVEAAFLRGLLKTDFGKGLGDLGFTRDMYDQLADQLAEVDVPTVLEAMGKTEQEAMLSDDIGFNDQLKELYQAGKLTYADVIRTQPAVFLPKS